MLGEFLKMGNHIHTQIASLLGNPPRIVESIYLWGNDSGTALLSEAQVEENLGKERKEVVQFILVGSVPTEGLSSLWDLIDWRAEKREDNSQSSAFNLSNGRKPSQQNPCVSN